MTKDELIEELKKIGHMPPMFFLLKANQLFIEFINDDKLKKAYGKVLERSVYKNK